MKKFEFSFDSIGCSENYVKKITVFAVLSTKD